MCCLVQITEALESPTEYSKLMQQERGAIVVVFLFYLSLLIQCRVYLKSAFLMSLFPGIFQRTEEAFS